MSLQRRFKKSVAPAIPASVVPPTELLLVDIKTASRMLSCSVWVVRSLLWSKEIPHIRIGKKFLIDPADLRAYIQRQKEVA